MSNERIATIEMPIPQNESEISSAETRLETFRSLEPISRSPLPRTNLLVHSKILK